MSFSTKDSDLELVFGKVGPMSVSLHFYCLGQCRAIVWDKGRDEGTRGEDVTVGNISMRVSEIV